MDGKWRKMNAGMITMFGKPYMVEDDWRIDI